MLKKYFVFLLIVSTSFSYADDVQIGKEIYHEHCASCHGREMQNPGLAFDLKKFPKDDYQRFQTSVLNGKGSGMPAWKTKLNQEDIECLWSYIRFGFDN